MPKSAKTSAGKRSVFHRPQRDGKTSKYWSFREKVEGMYLLHLFLLLVMCSLTAGLFVIAVQQRIEIQSLEFRLDFMNDRYSILRNREMLEAEELDEIEAETEELTQAKPSVQQ